MKENAVFLACLAPFLRLVWLGLHARLGVNPVEFVEHRTGDWALNFFCLTLAVTPLVRTTGWSWWAKRRRMLGLFVSFYAALHFLTYLILDVELSVPEFLHDARRRPYILAGAAALAVLVPLTITSTDAMIRRLKRWWGRLHRLVYLAAALGVVHYWWLVKADTRKPLRYAAAIGLLLLYRAAAHVRRRFAIPAGAVAALSLAVVAGAPATTRRARSGMPTDSGSARQREAASSAWVRR